jgi:hypothetical protein
LEASLLDQTSRRREKKIHNFLRKKKKENPHSSDDTCFEHVLLFSFSFWQFSHVAIPKMAISCKSI